jgi:hypothetical protein
VPCEEGGQVTVGRILKDGQVAAVDDFAAKPTRPLYEPAKVWMDLGGTSGKIHDRNVVRCDHLETALQRSSRHRFASIATRIDGVIPTAWAARLDKSKRLPERSASIMLMDRFNHCDYSRVRQAEPK